MDAQRLFTAVQPLGVTGLSILDVNDPATWTFQGEYDRDTVIAAIQGTLPSAAPASSQFWAAPLTQEQRDIAALKQQITGA
jgi:hypothetical protein